MQAPTLRTDRLVLRGWEDSDRNPFAELNADPAVMEHFPHTLTRAQSDAFVDRVCTQFAETGWGLWAVAVTGPELSSGEPEADFIGFVGLWPGDHVQPGAVEVGWRLARRAWGCGYAPEAATAALRHGFETVGLDEIVSFTVPRNTGSRRVMEKIGLRHRPELDFDHPNVDGDTHPHLVRHVLYSITRPEWQALHAP